MATLTEFPKRFAAGTTVKLTLSFPDYPASAGWVLAVLLNGPPPSKLTKAGNANGDDFDVTLDAGDTDDLVPGAYRVIARVTRGGEKYDPWSGTVAITPNPETAAAGAFLSYEEKTLAVIEAAINGVLTDEMSSYQIDGIAVVALDLDTLEQLRVKYQNAVNLKRNGGRSMRINRISFGRTGGS